MESIGEEIFMQLRQMMTMGEVSSSDVLFFVGYSGWGPNQLEKELDQKILDCSPSGF